MAATDIKTETNIPQTVEMTRMARSRVSATVVGLTETTSR